MASGATFTNASDRNKRHEAEEIIYRLIALEDARTRQEPTTTTEGALSSSSPQQQQQQKLITVDTKLSEVQDAVVKRKRLPPKRKVDNEAQKPSKEASQEVAPSNIRWKSTNQTKPRRNRRGQLPNEESKKDPLTSGTSSASLHHQQPSSTSPLPLKPVKGAFLGVSPERRRKASLFHDAYEEDQQRPSWIEALPFSAVRTLDLSSNEMGKGLRTSGTGGGYKQVRGGGRKLSPVRELRLQQISARKRLFNISDSPSSSKQQSSAMKSPRPLPEEEEDDGASIQLTDDNDNSSIKRRPTALTPPPPVSKPRVHRPVPSSTPEPTASSLKASTRTHHRTSAVQTDLSTDPSSLSPLRRQDRIPSPEGKVTVEFNDLVALEKERRRKELEAFQARKAAKQKRLDEKKKMITSTLEGLDKSNKVSSLNVLPAIVVQSFLRARLSGFIVRMMRPCLSESISLYASRLSISLKKKGDELSPTSSIQEGRTEAEEKSPSPHSSTILQAAAIDRLQRRTAAASSTTKPSAANDEPSAALFESVNHSHLSYLVRRVNAVRKHGPRIEEQTVTIQTFLRARRSRQLVQRMDDEQEARMEEALKDLMDF